MVSGWFRYLKVKHNRRIYVRISLKNDGLNPKFPQMIRNISYVDSCFSIIERSSS